MLIRVKDPATGHEFTTTDTLAAERGYQPVRKPAVDSRSGEPLPPKPRLAVDEAAEQPRKPRHTRRTTTPAAPADQAADQAASQQ